MPLKPTPIKSLIVCLLIGLFIGCHTLFVQAYTPATTPGQQPADFRQWLQQLRSEALSQGIDARLFDKAFRNMTVDPRVITADTEQPEFTRPIWQYLDGALSERRIQRGQRLLKQHEALLASIEQSYAVDREILVAIWGLESNFGDNIGRYQVLRSLATLAYQGRRQSFWQDQLMAALHILQDGDISHSRMLGSWAGAMGHTQFMPTTYRQYAVDFDKNGRRDLWNSPADALASTANYLQASGWTLGQPWGFEVRLPEAFDYTQADPAIRRSLQEWQQLGVEPFAPTAIDPETSATLLLPAGHQGPAFLLLHNYRAILEYNRSTSYAMAVALLAANLRQPSPINRPWPRHEYQLSRSERIELQQQLLINGQDPGSVDGIIGIRTRRAIRSLQQELELPADGQPTLELLQHLRGR